MNLFSKNSKADCFISEAEKFLRQFDATNPLKSGSQLKEIAKYNRVNYLRDHTIKSDEKTKLWEGF